MNDLTLELGALAPHERMEKLIVLCEERLRGRPHDLQARIEFARILRDSGQLVRAAEYVRLLLAQNPGNSELRAMIQDCSKGLAGGNR
jgi:hypothetical protein